jgi:hypothetical protein
MCSPVVHRCFANTNSALPCGLTASQWKTRRGQVVSRYTCAFVTLAILTPDLWCVCRPWLPICGVFGDPDSRDVVCLATLTPEMWCVWQPWLPRCGVLNVQCAVVLLSLCCVARCVHGVLRKLFLVSSFTVRVFSPMRIAVLSEYLFPPYTELVKNKLT